MKTMKTAGIIAEYNPFHNGHRYLNEQARKKGFDCLVAVMSGELVQRGEPALFSKWVRTRAALQNGIDLVLELPVPYALGSAERFAAGAVGLLSAAGCIDALFFGSECGNSEALSSAAEACLTVQKSGQLNRFLKQGFSYPAARQKAVAAAGAEKLAALLSAPNNILGIEYIKAMRNLNVPFRAVTVRREGTEHDGQPANGFSSAAWLREQARKGIKMEALRPYIPESVWEYYQRAEMAQPFRLDMALLFQLRRMTASEFAYLPDVTEGLENRLYEAAQTAVSIEDFLSKVKTKRYTHARLRRTVFHAAVGICREDMLTAPPYLRVLGFNARGRELLRLMKQVASLPIVSSFSALKTLSPAAERFAKLEKNATDLRGLATEPPMVCNRDYIEKIITELS